MTLTVRTSGEIPIYRQLIRQIVEAVSVGILRPGDKLSSHRDLAEELVIAPLTVKKAYDELERLGYLETQRGRGTFVREKPPVRKASALRKELRAIARQLISQAYLANFELEDVMELIEETAAEMTPHVEKA